MQGQTVLPDVDVILQLSGVLLSAASQFILLRVRHFKLTFIIIVIVVWESFLSLHSLGWLIIGFMLCCGYLD